MNDSAEIVNLQKADFWNHQKLTLKILITEIRQIAHPMPEDRGDRNVPCNSLFQQICMPIHPLNPM